MASHSGPQCSFDAADRNTLLLQSIVRFVVQVVGAPFTHGPLIIAIRNHLGGHIKLYGGPAVALRPRV